MVIGRVTCPDTIIRASFRYPELSEPPAPNERCRYSITLYAIKPAIRSVFVILTLSAAKRKDLVSEILRCLRGSE